MRHYKSEPKYNSRLYTPDAFIACNVCNRLQRVSCIFSFPQKQEFNIWNLNVNGVRGTRL